MFKQAGSNIITILALAILGLAFLQYSSCNDAKAFKAQQDSIMRINAPLVREVAQLRAQNDSLNLAMAVKDTVYSHNLDSLTHLIDSGRHVQRFQGQRIQNLITRIRDYGTETKDSSVVQQSNDLQAAVDSAKNTVVFLEGQSSQKDTLYQAIIDAKDSVIRQKDRIIQNLALNFDGSQNIISKLNSELSVSINSDRRKDILRTIGEAALVLGLLLKK